MKGPSPMRDVVEAMARAIHDAQRWPNDATWDEMVAQQPSEAQRQFMHFATKSARAALRAALVAMRERMTFDAGEIDAALAALAELDAEANP